MSNRLASYIGLIKPADTDARRLTIEKAESLEHGAGE